MPGRAPTANARFPAAPKGPVVDTLHGVKVPDPYRWLEAINSADTQAWAARENQLTEAYLSKLPGRDDLRARLTALEGNERYLLPFHRGHRYFWGYSDGKQSQVATYTAASLADKPELLIDPNAISLDGKLAFDGLTISQDGAAVAYGLAKGGGDWTTWHVRRVGEAQDAPDIMEHVKYYRPSFAHDGKDLYYSRFPAPSPGKEISETDHDSKVYRHVLGTPASADQVVYERPDHPSWQFMPVVSDDGRYLVISVGDGQVGDRGQELLYYFDLKDPHAKPVALVDMYEAEYVFLGNDGPVFYVQTSLDAPNKRVIAIDTRHPDRSAWREVVPNGTEAIDSSSLVGKQVFVTRLKDAHSAVSTYSLRGKKLADVELPGLGTAGGFDGTPDSRETFYFFTSFTAPPAVYRYDLATRKSALWKQTRLPFDASAFETHQVFYPSKDGTKVPMFVVSKKGIKLDGKNPTLLTGYGNGGFSLTPFFSTDTLVWLEHGGVFALANIRGGGEYGEAWHRQATGIHKQRSYDDFIAAGEWLVANHYTSREHLGIFGTSGGGMLVGVALTERPDLFGAAVPISGVLDMLRFHLFGQGAGWEGDNGNPEDAEAFRALLAYSPVHNVRTGTPYPPTLVVTQDHDERVTPLHSYKFAAALQAAQAGPAPILLQVQTSSGHGGGFTRASQIEQTVDRLSFFAFQLGMALQASHRSEPDSPPHP